MDILNFFGSILGYLLWFLYLIFRNYGVAIIFFTIILKVALFPMSLKQQKSMASQTKLTAKQKELQQKYANNKQKYNEELQKLYEKEGVNPGAGCLTTLLPFPIMLGIYYSVIYPLSNTLHIASETIANATSFISRIPGMTTMGVYSELEIIRNFQLLKDNSSFIGIFSGNDIEKMDSFSKGFSFLGLDLLSSPQNSPFTSFLWIIPLLSLLTSFAFQFYTSKTNQNGTQGQPGCMKVMMYVFPLISVYWAYIMPGAVGFYWVTSSVVSSLQSVLTNKFFSANHMTAMSEAQRALALDTGEAALKPLPPAAQKQIAERLAAATAAAQQKKLEKKTEKKKQKKSSGKNTGDYLGDKK